MKIALREAGQLREDPPRAMAALMRAKAWAPEHTAVLIAVYGHRLAAARDVARQALAVGTQQLGLPPVWRDVPARALFGAKDDATTCGCTWMTAYSGSFDHPVRQLTQRVRRA